MSSGKSAQKTRKRKRKSVDSDEEWQPSSENEIDYESDYDASNEDQAASSSDNDIDIEIDSKPKRKRQRLLTKTNTKNATNTNTANDTNDTNSTITENNENNEENSKNSQKNSPNHTQTTATNDTNDTNVISNTNTSNTNETETKSDSDGNDSENNSDEENQNTENNTNDTNNRDGGNEEETEEEMSAAEKARLKKLKKQYRHALKQLNELTAASEYKSILSFIKNLRDSDRNTPLSDRVKLTGKKDELYNRCKQHILDILCHQAPKSTDSYGWRGMRSMWFFGGRGVNWDEWSESLLVFVDNLAKNKQKQIKRKQSGLFNKQTNQRIKQLEQRLQTLEKSQIVELVMELINKNEEMNEMNSNNSNNSNNNSNNSNNCDNNSDYDLVSQIIGLLPQPNLDEMFDKHKKLINGISRAKPWTRYGSSSDHYSYKRCKSAITHARTAMVNDGNFLLKTKEWDVIIKYLKVSVKHCDDFPTWDCCGDNEDVKKVRNQLNKMYLATLKGLEIESIDKNGNFKAVSVKQKGKNKNKNKNKAMENVTDQMKKDLTAIADYFAEGEE